MTRWGICGTGNVAHAFVEALQNDVPGAEVSVVGSREIGRAQEFAAAYAIPMWCRYEDLWDAPFCDVVYIATPASHHFLHAFAALEAGKHVLVEKPFTVNGAQANYLRTLADASDQLLMEAMWSRFLPSYQALNAMLDEHRIGEIHALEASFGGKASYQPDLRPFRLDLAGGALMDGGIYPIHLAHLVFGIPERVTALRTKDWADGVDGGAAVTLSYPTGRFATLSTSLQVTLNGTATIHGTEGMIQIPGNFTNPSYLAIARPDQPLERIECIPDKHRLAYQAIEVQRCLAEGITSSPLMAPLESCAIMETMDAVRHRIGLRFPDEAEAL